MTRRPSFFAVLMLVGALASTVCAQGLGTVAETPPSLDAAQFRAALMNTEATELAAGPGDSLGTMIRDRTREVEARDPSASFRAWLTNQRRKAEEQTNDEAAEREDRASDPATEENDSSRQRSTSAHVMQLKKPIRDVRIQATESGKRVPENRAARFSRHDPLIMIAALGAGPPLPDRYTVGFLHRPLYFEQPNLERCGRSCRYLQNAISGVQFLATTIWMPYYMCRQCPDCLVPAGGDCKTCERYPLDCKLFPLDQDALMTQAAASAGFSFLLL